MLDTAFDASRLTVVYGKRVQGVPLKLHVYADFNHGGEDDTRLSTVFFYAGAVVSHRSVRQKALALSSTKAEHYASASAAREASWPVYLFTSTGIDTSDVNKVLIYGDDQGVLALAGKPRLPSADQAHRDSTPLCA